MFNNPFVIDGLRLVAVVLLVLANGFFVASEFSLVSVRKTRIYELVAQGDPDASSVARAIEDPDSVIAATQLGITLSSLGLGWLGEPDYDTIAGYLLGRLGRMAKVGDSITVDSTRLQVEAMDGRRISQLSLTPLSHRVHHEGPSPTEGAGRN